MKKFICIYLVFILIPLILCIIVYLIGCFTTLKILPIENVIEWVFVRIYVMVSAFFAFVISLDKDL